MQLPKNCDTRASCLRIKLKCTLKITCFPLRLCNGKGLPGLQNSIELLASLSNPFARIGMIPVYHR
jgi:hypothetical protein